MRHITAVLMLALITLSYGLNPNSGPYGDLVSAFGSGKPLHVKPIPSRTIVLSSTKHKGAFSYNDIIDIRLAPNAIEFAPSFPLMHRVQIPPSKISGAA